jgi:hypothetical protein
MQTTRAVRRAPLVVALIFGVVAAIVAVTAVWAGAARAEDSTTPERDRSHTISGSDDSATGEFGATAIDGTATASAIAKSITRDTTFVTGASYVAKPPSGKPNAVSTTALTGFPRHGKSYGILTSGSAALADDANSSGGSGADLDGPNVRGNTDFDVSILKIKLSVPSGANCLAFDFRFLSEEYPEWVGSSFNDTFIAELDNSTWTTSGSAINAPNNFAFDENGQEISINSTGAASVSAVNSSGTTYDAATQRLSARTPITPGAHSLYLSIFDQGDQIYDSAVFLDNLDLFASASVDCQTGAQGGPTIVTVDPEVGETGVARNTNVTATFSKEMDSGTLDSSTVKLQKRIKKNGKFRWVSVSAGVSCNSPCQTVTLDPYPADPSKLLGANRSHRVLVKGGDTGVKDSAGTPMQQTAKWIFKTGSS